MGRQGIGGRREAAQMEPQNGKDGHPVGIAFALLASTVRLLNDQTYRRVIDSEWTRSQSSQKDGSGSESLALQP